MGSLGTDTNITDITYKNVYTWASNQVSTGDKTYFIVDGLTP